ncbi:hypothetical protein DOT_2652 [Desulfosporosinus sp. OT]|nr:hypothetical protein DOT_2652 [Desulfosporosinus sp. OT]
MVIGDGVALKRFNKCSLREEIRNFNIMYRKGDVKTLLF